GGHRGVHRCRTAHARGAPGDRARCAAISPARRASSCVVRLPGDGLRSESRASRESLRKRMYHRATVLCVLVCLLGTGTFSDRAFGASTEETHGTGGMVAARSRLAALAG